MVLPLTEKDFGFDVCLWTVFCGGMFVFCGFFGSDFEFVASFKFLLKVFPSKTQKKTVSVAGLTHNQTCDLDIGLFGFLAFLKFPNLQHDSKI